MVSTRGILGVEEVGAIGGSGGPRYGGSKVNGRRVFPEVPQLE